MINVENAQKLVDQHFSWQTLYPEIHADRDYPPFDRVMMDGIAVDFDEYQKGRREFHILDIQKAGEPQKTLVDPEAALEVMTGSVLPLSTSLVIQYEHLKIERGVAKVIKEIERKKWESVHLKGSDKKKGELVLASQCEKNGPHVGIAASMGRSFNPIANPKIKIISTGDELVEVEEIPLAHQIRRSNVHALKRSLELFGFENIATAHLNDDAQEVYESFEEDRTHFDILLYSGGVSEGKYDFLPRVFADAGVERIFHQVAQRPGKPLWFGRDPIHNTMIIGLPGNPVSSLVCLHRYFLPQKKIRAKLMKEVKFDKDLTYFMPVKIEFHQGALCAYPLEIKNSGEFTALAQSDGFIELPREKNLFLVDEVYPFFPWRPW